MPMALSGAVAAVELMLERELSALDLPERLRDAVAYATLGPGKRLRPALTLLSWLAIETALARSYHNVLLPVHPLQNWRPIR